MVAVLIKLAQMTEDLGPSMFFMGDRLGRRDIYGLCGHDHFLVRKIIEAPWHSAGRLTEMGRRGVER